MALSQSPWQGVSATDKTAMIARNREKMVPRRVTMEENADEYTYTFDPGISTTLLQNIWWGDISSIPFARTLKLASGDNFAVLFFKKNMPRKYILAIFERLSEAGVVDIKITTERYPDDSEIADATANRVSNIM